MKHHVRLALAALFVACGFIVLTGATVGLAGASAADPVAANAYYGAAFAFGLLAATSLATAATCAVLWLEESK